MKTLGALKKGLCPERNIKLGFANFDVVYYDFAGQARTEIS